MSCCTNVGPADRAFRALLGVGALVVAFVGLDVQSGALGGLAAALVGVVMLATAGLGFCPLYLPFRASTCRTTPK